MTYRLDIWITTANGTERAVYWKNFIDYAGPYFSTAIDDPQLDEWRACYRSDESGEKHGTYLEFESKEDMIAFLMRWS